MRRWVLQCLLQMLEPQAGPVTKRNAPLMESGIAPSRGNTEAIPPNLLTPLSTPFPFQRYDRIINPFRFFSYVRSLLSDRAVREPDRIGSVFPAVYSGIIRIKKTEPQKNRKGFHPEKSGIVFHAALPQGCRYRL